MSTPQDPESSQNAPEPGTAAADATPIGERPSLSKTRDDSGTPPSATGGQQPLQPGGYPSCPQQPDQPYYPSPAPPGTQVYSIIAFGCAAVAVLFCPLIVGPAGVVLGLIGHYQRESLGKWAAGTAAAGMVLGSLLGFVLFNGDPLL